MNLSPRHLAVLVLLTLCWGLNWPVMKIGVTGFPPLTFRALSMLLGVPVLGLALWALGVPFRIPRKHWRELARLTLANMVVWHVLVILAVPMLSSGRAAILGYTMPVFSALWGMALFGQRLGPRQAVGVAAAALGVLLLLWHELGRLAGAPAGVAMMLFAAATWALGTQWLRAAKMPVPTLAIAFWMTAVTTVVVCLAALLFESARWHVPSGAVSGAILFNAVAIFGFAHAAWFFLARSLPPVASTLSVMLIPVLGTVSGALWLHETLHWQDGAAMLLMMAAIASVLWPSMTAPRRYAPPPEGERPA
jgi:drug/metabolite transporter (DMT)-like permease